MSWGELNIRMCKNIQNRPLHKLDRDGGLCDWATHRNHRSLTRLLPNAKSWKLCHFVEGTDTKKKCLRCNWHHVIVQLSNDYSVSSSTYTHVEAWALLPALGRQCWGWPSRHEQWCGCVLTTGWAGPWLNLGVHYTICFFLHHAAKRLGQPHDSCYLLLPLANFLVLSLNLTIPIVS